MGFQHVLCHFPVARNLKLHSVGRDIRTVLVRSAVVIVPNRSARCAQYRQAITLARTTCRYLLIVSWEAPIRKIDNPGMIQCGSILLS